MRKAGAQNGFSVLVEAGGKLTRHTAANAGKHVFFFLQHVQNKKKISLNTFSFK